MKKNIMNSSFDIENKLASCGFTLEQEKEFYNEVLSRVYSNPRFYLDNIDKLSVFRVSFINYTAKKKKDL